MMTSVLTHVECIQEVALTYVIPSRSCHLTRKTVADITYDVFGGTLSLTQPQPTRACRLTI